MTTTTIKLHTKTKHSLDSFRLEAESYDDIIGRLISQARYTHLKKELKEGYLASAERDRQIEREWDSTSVEIDE